MTAFVEIAQLGKTYDTPAGPAVIVHDFTLYVDEGEFVCLLGHSGCGKTTVLSILMGLTTPSTGGVVISPLFPRANPCAEYLTLEEALPLGFHMTEVDAAGAVPGRCRSCWL